MINPMINAVVISAMQREIALLRKELAVARAIIDRLTAPAKTLSPAPLHKPVKLGKIEKGADR